MNPQAYAWCGIFLKFPLSKYTEGHTRHRYRQGYGDVQRKGFKREGGRKHYWVCICTYTLYEADVKQQHKAVSICEKKTDSESNIHKTCVIVPDFHGRSKFFLTMKQRFKFKSFVAAKQMPDFFIEERRDSVF